MSCSMNVNQTPKVLEDFMLLSEITKRQFIESYKCGKKVLTPLGYKEIEYIHKTIPYEKYRIETENGFVLECAYNHVIILDNGDECYAKDCLSKIVKTQRGDSKIINCVDLNVKENMYDITIKEDTELYYTNGILSHNCGKSVMTAIYLTWKFLFTENINIGICANKGSLAREFLNNVKMIFGFLPMWMRVGVTVWNKGSISSESNTRILTDVPSQNSFRGFSISILVIDEVAFIRSTMWQEFADSIFPSQSSLSWKKNILISTPNGINHWKSICDDAESGKSGYKYHFVNWRDVPRFDSKGNVLDPDTFKDNVVRKNGITFFSQNYACDWIGSSCTLVSSDALSNMRSKEPILMWDRRLNIYEEPVPKHKYIMAVDPSKCYGDAFAVHVVDITTKPFIQVASAQLFDENFQIMPEFLDEWGRRYNNAFIIIENNEGAGTFVAVMLKNNYEYPNLFYDKTYSKVTPLGKLNKEPGFRTTVKSRNMILETMKLFLDNNLLIVNDKATITEFYTFIAINEKYQADNGYHDDMIMSLALSFAPFCNSRNFEDMTTIINTLYNKNVDENVLIGDYLTIGNFDDYSDENEYKEDKELCWSSLGWNSYGNHGNG